LVQIVVEETQGDLVVLPGAGHYIDAKSHTDIIEWLTDPPSTVG
jgi:hypothetical protein